MNADVLVLGAGMIGVSSALALQERGRRVVLVDRVAPGRETSWGNAGMIERTPVLAFPFPRDLGTVLGVATGASPLAQLRWSALPTIAPWLLAYARASSPAGVRAANLAMWPLAREARDRHARWLDAAGARALLRDTGYYEIFDSDAAFDGQAPDRQFAREHGVRFEICTRAQLREREPAVTGAFRQAVFWQDAASALSPGEVVEAYARLFTQRGGRFVQADASALRREASGFSLPAADNTTAGETLHAAEVVVALGPWSAALCQRFGYTPPLLGKRGYSRHYEFDTASAGGHPPPSCPLLLAERGLVITAMRPGIRITGGIEFARMDAPPTPGAVRRREAAARDLMPSIGAPIESEPWMGRRPALPDMKPVIGRCPTEPGLMLAFGHHHWGFSLGPSTGEFVAQLLCGEPTIADPAPFAAERFGR